MNLWSNDINGINVRNMNSIFYHIAIHHINGYKFKYFHSLLTKRVISMTATFIMRYEELYSVNQIKVQYIEF